MAYIEREECGDNPNAKMSSNPLLCCPLVIFPNHTSLSVDESVSSNKLLVRSSTPSENMIAPCMARCSKTLSLVVEEEAIQITQG